LTSWNSLMITAFVEGYKATGKEQYLEQALKAANFLLQKMKVGNRLMRVWGQPVQTEASQGGHSTEIVKLQGCLDDYAYFIEALLNIASVDADSKWLLTADELCQSMIANFRDELEGGFFFTAGDHEKLVVRPRSHYDGSVPSGTSVATCCLLKLAKLTGKAEYLNLVEEIFRLYSPHFTRMPDQFANLLNAMDMYLFHGPEIALILPPASRERQDPLLLAIHSKFYPNKVMAVARAGDQKAEDEGKGAPALTLFQDRVAENSKTTVYICRNFTCEQPVNDLDKLKEKIADW